MDYSLKLIKNQGISYLTSPKLNKNHKIFIAFTNKDTGNLGLHVGDLSTSVIKNRQKLCEATKIDLNDLTCAKQTHSDNFTVVKKSDVGRGSISYDVAIDNCDCLITKEAGVPLALFFADCLPLILVALDSREIAVIHAGRKGVKREIATKVLKKLLQSHPTESIRAFIGPHVGDCCYEVDLEQTVRRQLIGLGIPKSNVVSAGICTSCQNKHYFSYRVDNKCGRQAALAIIKK
ncbi:MAG: laccase domain-containing protein [Actinobacteria bacterium]|nr:MAG: laccase domain-containing protein [Actinomycetota bacterium]